MNHKTVSLLIIAIAVSLSLCGCFNKRWTEKRKKEFEENCHKTDTVANLYVEFKDFEWNEFDSVLIKEYHGAELIDSFKVLVKQPQTSFDKENEISSTRIERTLNIKNRYEFVIPGEKSHVLENMKMIMWPQFTMLSEGWGCRMGEYTVDGVTFTSNAEPRIVKRISASE